MNLSWQILDFQFPLPMWVSGLLILPTIIGLVVWAYRSPRRAKSLRITLSVLRISLLGVALFFVLGPFLRKDQTLDEPAAMAFLLDDSASMQRVDVAGESRLAAMQKLLRNPGSLALNERYDLKAWSFAQSLDSTAVDGSGLTAAGTSSATASAMHSLLKENRGQALRRIVLFSDGRRNEGLSYLHLTQELILGGIRVDAIGFGETRAAPNLILERVQSPQFLLVGDEGIFRLRLRGVGGAVGKKTQVHLQDKNGSILQTIRIPAVNSKGTLINFNHRFEEAGEFQLFAEANAVAGESALQDNRVAFSLTVDPVKIRVLYVDGEPRWEYRYLKNRLLRATRDVVATCWLTAARHTDFEQEHSRGVPALRRLPLTSEELLENYDVVLLGDVDPRQFATDPQDGARFLQSVAEFVQHGGGLLMMAGPKHNPSAFRGSPIEELLPVYLSNDPPQATFPFQPVPADPQRPAAAVFLTSDPAENLHLWESAEALYWYQPIGQLRPGAQAWLTAASPEGAATPRIILAVGPYPEGRVGWLGTDETWRWRFPGGETVLEQLWRGVLRYLASARLRGDHGRVQLNTDRTQVDVGDAIEIQARILDESWQPKIYANGVTIFADGKPQPIQLSPDHQNPGSYRGRIRPTAPGLQQLRFTKDQTPDGETLASVRVRVTFPELEMADTSQDAVALKQLCEATGGRLVSPGQAAELFKSMDGSEKRTRVLASEKDPLESLPWLFLFLGLACTEWLLRKWGDLS